MVRKEEKSYEKKDTVRTLSAFRPGDGRLFAEEYGIGCPDSVTEENGGETGNVSQGGETGGGVGELTFRGEKLSGEDAVLFSEIREAAGAEVLLFDCADYDGDGNREAFAFAGVNNDGILEGQRWFAGAEGAVPLKNGRGSGGISAG